VPTPPNNLGKSNNTGLLAMWKQALRDMGAEAPIIYVRPSDNVLVGFPAISAYLGVRSWATLYQWVELYGFPAVKRPDGTWMTTITSIDQWIWLAAEADNANRPHSRGNSKRVDIALERLQRRVNERNLRVARGESADGPDGAKPSWSYPKQHRENQVK